MTRHTGTITIFARALEPIHHGQGTEGNMSIIRRQDVVQRDGTLARVPTISGNSVRHMIRDGGVRYALDAMGIPDGSLSKPVVDLLFSGGSLGGKNGSTLAKARRVAELFPVLSLLGYSAGARIQAGRLEVHNLHLVCDENARRAPMDLIAEHEASMALTMRAGAYVSDDFGTRHDAARIASAQRYLAIEDAAKVDAGGEKKGKAKAEKPDDSTQMIYSYETIAAGSCWYGGVDYRDITDREFDALKASFSHACYGRAPDGGFIYAVGAKRGVGLGKMSWHFANAERIVTAPTFESRGSLLPTTLTQESSAHLDAYTASLRERRDEIMRELEELAS